MGCIQCELRQDRRTRPFRQNDSCRVRRPCSNATPDMPCRFPAGIALWSGPCGERAHFGRYPRACRRYSDLSIQRVAWRRSWPDTSNGTSPTFVTDPVPQCAASVTITRTSPMLTRRTFAALGVAAGLSGPAPVSFRSGAHFRRPSVRRPRVISSRGLSVFCVGCRSR